MKVGSTRRPPRAARACRRRPADRLTTSHLRPHRHDHRVLDRLRFHQAENLGVEVLAGPTGGSAAGNLAAAQVHRLDPGEYT